MLRHFSSPERIFRLLRKNFLAGLFILLPFAVVAWILFKIVGALWGFLEIIPEEWQPINHYGSFTAQLLNFLITAFFTVFFVFAVSVLGWVSKQYLGKKFLSVLGYLIQRIPVVRAVYSSLNQLLQTLAAGGDGQFSRVVYVEYPRRDCWALAFVTGPGHGPGEGPYLNLYVPTTPNPTSGFHLIVPEADVRESHLSVEQAFKTILSLGIAQEEQVT